MQGTIPLPDLLVLRLDQIICISNKFPGDIDAAGLGTTLWDVTYAAYNREAHFVSGYIMPFLHVLPTVSFFHWSSVPNSVLLPKYVKHVLSTET